MTSGVFPPAPSKKNENVDILKNLKFAVLLEISRAPSIQLQRLVWVPLSDPAAHMLDDGGRVSKKGVENKEIHLAARPPFYTKDGEGMTCQFFARFSPSMYK